MTGGCYVHPDPRANGTYYTMSAVQGAHQQQFILQAGCNSSCGVSCNMTFYHTLGVCAPSVFNPTNESVVLNPTPCFGGVNPTSSPALTDITGLHYNYNSDCTSSGASDLSESAINFGTPNGTCVALGSSWFKLSSAGPGLLSVWWNCSASDCTGCNVTNQTVMINQCLLNFAPSGSFQFVPTTTLTSCQYTPLPSSTVYLTRYASRDGLFNNT